MSKLLLIPLGFYVAILVLLFVFQGRMLFPAAGVRQMTVLPADAVPLTLGVADGATLHGVHLPAGPSAARRPVLLGFGGNAWNAADMASYLHQLFPAHDIVAFHYRGYAPSGGRASARALVEDAPRVHDAVAKAFPGRRIVAIGFSVGSAVAASLAARRPLAGLILVTPFDSLAAVAADQVRWVPVRLLIRHDIDAAAALAAIRVPTAVVAAGHDSLVPAARTEALRRRVAVLAYDRMIPGAGHNDIYERSDFHAAIRDALAAVILPARGEGDRVKRGGGGPETH
jgi:pimeloyl-ACP methyl ester carboxylesterase